MNKVVKNTPIDGELTKSEKINVIVTLIIGVPWTLFIYNVGWKNKLPQKVKQVNKYFWRLLLGLVGLAVLGIILSIAMVAITDIANKLQP